jgi:alpha-glucosidase
MIRHATLEFPPRFHLAKREAGRVTLWSDTGAEAHIFVLEQDILRLVVLPDARMRQSRTWAIAPGQEDVPDDGRDRFDLDGFSLPDFALDTSHREQLVVSTDRVRLSIGLAGLRCRWSLNTPQGWIEVACDRPTQAYDFGWWDGKVRHYLVRNPSEQYFGLGEKTGVLDRAGRRFRMNNTDAMGYDAQTSDPLYKHLPFYITRQPDTGLAFGLFYDTLSDCVFDMGCERSNYHGIYRYFEADHGDLDLYFIGGPAVSQVTERFTWLTGKPAAMPDWAIGYSGSTMSYTDAEDAQVQMGVFLDQLARHKLPCSSFHLSSGYTSINSRRYVFNWNRRKFPEPRAFVERYTQAGVRLVANIKPALLDDHPAFETLEERGLFLKDCQGNAAREQFWDGAGAYLDFTNPDTAAWWKENLTRQLLDLGIVSTWNDNNEFEVSNPRAMAHGFGRPFPAREMKPLQTLLMMRASRQAQLSHAPDETPFLVSRAGATGMHRYVQTWSGDNFTSWETLKYNIRMGLGLALSGISNIGHDVGGFAGPAPERELLLRWIGFGVFMPRFSIHSWNEDGSTTEPWMYPEAIETVQALFALREALRPDIITALADYREHYTPAVRPIFYDFPDDPDAWNDTDDFLLGRDILVAPVVQPGMTHRQIRLPRGALWRDPYAGVVYAGGEVIEVDAPLDRPPYLRRLPLEPDLTSA